MKPELFERLAGELLRRGCTKAHPSAAFDVPNNTMPLDGEWLAAQDLVEFLDFLVRRRQKIEGSVEVEGQDNARASYDDVEVVIASVKAVLHHALASGGDEEVEPVVNPRTPRVRDDQELRRAITPYENADVTVWSYSASHRTLVLRLTVPRWRGNVHVICEGCASITAPSLWAAEALHLVGDGKRVKLTDDAAGFAVECSLVRVDRDVPPLY